MGPRGNRNYRADTYLIEIERGGRGGEVATTYQAGSLNKAKECVIVQIDYEMLRER